MILPCSGPLFPHGQINMNNKQKTSEINTFFDDFREHVYQGLAGDYIVKKIEGGFEVTYSYERASPEITLLKTRKEVDAFLRGKVKP